MLKAVSWTGRLWYFCSQFSSVAPKLNKKKERAISRPFAIAIRAARLLTAWLRYRSHVVVGLKRSLPTIPECLQTLSFARSKQDEEVSHRRQGSFRA